MGIFRYLFIITLFLFVTGVKAKATVVFVSSSEGCDSSHGLTVNSPLRTIKAAMHLADSIYLKAGDIFYEQVSFKNKFVTRYGIGTNPVISGFKILNTQGKWKRVEGNIWVIDLSGRFYSGYDTHGASLLNNVGCIYDVKRDQVHGNKVRYYSQLKDNWDIWQTEKFKGVIIPEDFSHLYLYLDSDPNLLTLSFSIGGIGVSLSNSTLSFVNVIGFGFGISAGSNVEISNCKVDIIGGMTHCGREWFINYGNGIEFYVANGIVNSRVHDCYISRTYDSGITIQANSENHIPRDIKIYHNLIERCCQAWEDFLMTPNDTVIFHNCEFFDNTVIHSGKPGFTYPNTRSQFCHIYGLNNKGDKGMIIRDNTFAGGNFYHSTSYHGRYKSNKWENNICYLSSSNFFLCDHDGITNKIIASERVKDNEKSIYSYRVLTGDDTKFYVYGEAKVNRIAKRLKRKFLRHHSY